jgi:hypothetical protein
MVDGFWLLQYEGIQGSGGGVLVLLNGRVFGGDSAYYYTGSYETKGPTLKARVQVRNFLAGVASALGVEGDFELDVVGALEGDVIRGAASLVSTQGTGVAIKLTRRAKLTA